MSSIFKRRKGKNEPYSIQYTDHDGKRRTAKGFTDRGLSDQLLVFSMYPKLLSTGVL